MKTCPNCNAEMADNAAFCTKCGTKLGETILNAQAEHTSEQAAAEQQNAQQQQETQGQQYQQTQQSQQYQQTQQNQQYQQQAYYQYSQPIDIYDHTAEFDTKDISDNKVIAMLVYLLGTIGIIIALLASQTSPYVAFHVRQALKFTVIDILLGIVALVLCFTIIVPIAAGIMMLVLAIVRIICFFQICGGKAKEPAIIRSFKFLR